MTILRKTFSGTGRPRRASADRYPGGQIRHSHRKPEETQDQVMQTALRARMRHFGVSKDDARDPDLGSALGRLRRLGAANGGVSGRQYDAGVRFARCMSLQAVLDDLRPAYGVPVLARLSCVSGRDPYDRIDPELAWDSTDEKRRIEIIATIRRDAADAVSALWEVEAYHSGVAYVVNRVVCWDDLSILGASENRLGSLRCGLNALAKLWQIAETKG